MTACCVQVLDKADIVFAALFTTEMIMKLIAFGALRCGPRYVVQQVVKQGGH